MNHISTTLNKHYFSNTSSNISKQKSNLHIKDKLWQASKDFESLFLYKMFKQMNKSIEKTSLIKNNQASLYFKDMLLEQRSKIAVENSQLGLAKIIYEQNIKKIE